MAQKSNSKEGMMVGIGLAALAAAAAGAYLLYGKDGEKNRKKIKSWALKAKAEVLEKMEKAKDMSESTYQQIVEDVSKKYGAIKSIDPKELELLTKEMKGHWTRIAKHLKAAQKKGK
jgi:hypothetical protein